MVNKASEIIAIIPARGGSKGILRKNIVDFMGKPLIAWTIEHAIESKLIKKVFVSTDDQEIGNIAEKYGAEIIWRPSELATDIASSEDALIHAVHEIEKNNIFTTVVFLQATSPIRRPDTIDKAINYFNDSNADSLFSSNRIDDYCFWKEKDGCIESYTFDYRNRQRRQDMPDIFFENGSIYIFKKEILLSGKNRFGGKIVHFQMPKFESCEIDDPDDIAICEYYYNKYIKK